MKVQIFELVENQKLQLPFESLPYKAFFRMMQAVERAGIPSRFPHDSGFYELLASKRWTYYMALASRTAQKSVFAFLSESSCEEFFLKNCQLCQLNLPLCSPVNSICLHVLQVYTGVAKT